MTDLPPDPDALEQWKQLPQNPPSKDALPPLMGGGNLFRAWWFWLFVLFGGLALIRLIAEQL